LYQIFFADCFKNFSQPADMDIDGSVLDKDVITPDAIKQL
jgi:hypothetical protein